MRASEWIDLVVFCFLTALAWKRRIPSRQRAVVTGLGAAAIAGTLLAARFAPSIFRDWLPAALLLMVYWQAGQFFDRPDEKLQARLLALDARTVLPFAALLSANPAGRLLLGYVELAYLLCYPMVPLALGALYLLHARAHADRFWTVVLTSTYACYLMVPFIQTLPPRSLPGSRSGGPAPGPLRRFNLWILRHASIQMNTFPSAHVAASMACAFVLLSISLPVGALFLAVAVSIAMGAVLGRYHYFADAVLGTAVALAAALTLG
jgi:PAP2 superfamily